MSRAQPPLSPEVRALLDHEREIQPLPATVRARALARAHAAVVAGGDRGAAPAPAPRTRWAAAAAVFCLLSVAVGASAYQIRAHLATPPSHPPAASPAPAASVGPVGADRRGCGTRRRRRPRWARRSCRVPTRPAPSCACSGTRAPRWRAKTTWPPCRPSREHARLFKDGRLAEEREALRVKALAGLGRSEEARRAAAAFRARFPRSVLLPAVNQMSPSER